jgi:hypothetical protein
MTPILGMFLGFSRGLHGWLTLSAHMPRPLKSLAPNRSGLRLAGYSPSAANPARNEIRPIGQVIPQPSQHRRQHRHRRGHRRWIL